MKRIAIVVIMILATMSLMNTAKAGIYEDPARASYMEKEIIHFEMDDSREGTDGIIAVAEYTDTEGKGRSFRRMQYTNDKGDKISIVDFEENDYVTTDDSDKSTIDEIRITNLELGKIGRLVKKEKKSKALYGQATERLLEKLRKIEKKKNQTEDAEDVSL